MSSSSHYSKQKHAPEILPIAFLKGSFRFFLYYPLRIFVYYPFKFTLDVLAWAWRNTFGYGDLPEFENPRQRIAYINVKREYRRHRRFQTHAGLYLFVNSLVWIDAFTRPYYSNQSPFIFTIVWGVLLGLHYLRVRTNRQEDSELLDVLRQYGGNDSVYSEQKRKNMLYEETEDYDHFESDGTYRPALDDIAEFEDGEIDFERERNKQQRRQRR